MFQNGSAVTESRLHGADPEALDWRGHTALVHAATVSDVRPPRWSPSSCSDCEICNNCVEFQRSWDMCLQLLVANSDGKSLFKLWPEEGERTLLGIAKDSLSKLMLAPRAATHIRSMETLIELMEMRYGPVEIHGPGQQILRGLGDRNTALTRRIG